MRNDRWPWMQKRVWVNLCFSLNLKRNFRSSREIESKIKKTTQSNIEHMHTQRLAIYVFHCCSLCKYDNVRWSCWRWSRQYSCSLPHTVYTHTSSSHKCKRMWKLAYVCKKTFVFFFRLSEKYSNLCRSFSGSRFVR